MPTTKTITSSFACATAIGISLLPAQSFAQEGQPEDIDPRTLLNEVVGNATAQNSARAVVLADSNLITLGVMDFDPNEFIDFGDLNVGNEETLELRSQLTTYAFPWTFSRRNLSERISHQSKVSFSYVSADQDIALDDSNIINTLEEQTYIVSGENLWRYQLNKRWRLSAGLGASYLYYTNDFDYRDPQLTELKPFFERNLLNTSYSAWLLDPIIAASYQGQFYGYDWEYKAQLRYASGHTFATDSPGQETAIETARLSNSLIFHYDTPDVLNRHSQIRVLARRIDVSADAVTPMGAHHYYEFGAGWLVDTSNDISLIDNIGIGLSLNVGSNLSGGSLVILFNEEM